MVVDTRLILDKQKIKRRQNLRQQNGIQCRNYWQMAHEHQDHVVKQYARSMCHEVIQGNRME